MSAFHIAEVPTQKPFFLWGMHQEDLVQVQELPQEVTGQMN